MILKQEQVQKILNWCDNHEVKKPHFYCKISTIPLPELIEDDTDIRKKDGEEIKKAIEKNSVKEMTVEDLLHWLHAILGRKKNPEYVDYSTYLDTPGHELDSVYFRLKGERMRMPGTVHKALYQSVYAVIYGEKPLDDWFDEVMKALDSL
jgi:hypothetical protein